MKITPRKATESDIDLYFNWTNDTDTRNNSFNTQVVDYQSHTNWFLKKIVDKNTLMLVFENENSIPDRLRCIHSLLDHRYGGRQRTDVDGYDDITP